METWLNRNILDTNIMDRPSSYRLYRYDHKLRQGEGTLNIVKVTLRHHRYRFTRLRKQIEFSVKPAVKKFYPEYAHERPPAFTNE